MSHLTHDEFVEVKSTARSEERFSETAKANAQTMTEARFGPTAMLRMSAGTPEEKTEIQGFYDDALSLFQSREEEAQKGASFLEMIISAGILGAILGGLYGAWKGLQGGRADIPPTDPVPKGPAPKGTIIHLGQAHSDLRQPEYQSGDAFHQEILISQLKIAEFIQKKPRLPVFWESLSAALVARHPGYHDAYLKTCELFPKGLPTPDQVDSMSLNQKKFLYRHQAAGTLHLLGRLDIVYPALDPVTNQRVIEKLKAGLPLDRELVELLMEGREKAALSIMQKILGESFEGKAILIFGARHDMSLACDLAGYGLEYVDCVSERLWAMAESKEKLSRNEILLEKLLELKAKKNLEKSHKSLADEQLKEDLSTLKNLAERLEAKAPGITLIEVAQFHENPTYTYEEMPWIDIEQCLLSRIQLNQFIDRHRDLPIAVEGLSRTMRNTDPDYPAQSKLAKEIFPFGIPDELSKFNEAQRVYLSHYDTAVVKLFLGEISVVYRTIHPEAQEIVLREFQEGKIDKIFDYRQREAMECIREEFGASYRGEIALIFGKGKSFRELCREYNFGHRRIDCTTELAVLPDYTPRKGEDSSSMKPEELNASETKIDRLLELMKTHPDGLITLRELKAHKLNSKIELYFNPVDPFDAENKLDRRWKFTERMQRKLQERFYQVGDFYIDRKKHQVITPGERPLTLEERAQAEEVLHALAKEQNIAIKNLTISADGRYVMECYLRRYNPDTHNFLEEPSPQRILMDLDRQCAFFEGKSYFETAIYYRELAGYASSAIPSELQDSRQIQEKLSVSYRYQFAFDAPAALDFIAKQLGVSSLPKFIEEFKYRFGESCARHQMQYWINDSGLVLSARPGILNEFEKMQILRKIPGRVSDTQYVRYELSPKLLASPFADSTKKELPRQFKETPISEAHEIHQKINLIEAFRRKLSIPWSELLEILHGQDEVHEAERKGWIERISTAGAEVTLFGPAPKITEYLMSLGERLKTFRTDALNQRLIYHTLPLPLEMQIVAEQRFRWDAKDFGLSVESFTIHADGFYEATFAPFIPKDRLTPDQRHALEYYISSAQLLQIFSINNEGTGVSQAELSDFLDEPISESIQCLKDLNIIYEIERGKYLPTPSFSDRCTAMQMLAKPFAFKKRLITLSEMYKGVIPQTALETAFGPKICEHFMPDMIEVLPGDIPGKFKLKETFLELWSMQRQALEYKALEAMMNVSNQGKDSLRLETFEQALEHFVDKGGLYRHLEKVDAHTVRMRASSAQAFLELQRHFEEFKKMLSADEISSKGEAASLGEGAKSPDFSDFVKKNITRHLKFDPPPIAGFLKKFGKILSVVSLLTSGADAFGGETTAPAEKVTVLHAKQLHCAPGGMPQVTPTVRISVVMSQLKIIGLIQRNPGIPVMCEGMDKALFQYELDFDNILDRNVSYAREAKRLFPDGEISLDIAKLTLAQQGFIYEQGGPKTLFFLGKIQTLYPAEETETARITNESFRTSIRITEELSNAREKMLMLRIKTFFHEGKVIVTLGAKHDLKPCCEKSGYFLEEIDCQPSSAEIHTIRQAELAKEEHSVSTRAGKALIQVSADAGIENLLKLAKLIQAHPEVPVIDTRSILPCSPSVPDFRKMAEMAKVIFPRGIPDSVGQLTEMQKHFLQIVGPARTLCFLEVIPAVHTPINSLSEVQELKKLQRVGGPKAASQYLESRLLDVLQRIYSGPRSSVLVLQSISEDLSEFCRDYGYRYERVLITAETPTLPFMDSVRKLLGQIADVLSVGKAMGAPSLPPEAEVPSAVSPPKSESTHVEEKTDPLKEEERMKGRPRSPLKRRPEEEEPVEKIPPVEVSPEREGKLPISSPLKEKADFKSPPPQLPIRGNTALKPLPNPELGPEPRPVKVEVQFGTAEIPEIAANSNRERKPVLVASHPEIPAQAPAPSLPRPSVARPGIPFVPESHHPAVPRPGIPPIPKAPVIPRAAGGAGATAPEPSLAPNYSAFSPEQKAQLLETQKMEAKILALRADELVQKLFSGSTLSEAHHRTMKLELQGLMDHFAELKRFKGAEITHWTDRTHLGEKVYGPQVTIYPDISVPPHVKTWDLCHEIYRGAKPFVQAFGPGLLGGLGGRFMAHAAKQWGFGEISTDAASVIGAGIFTGVSALVMGLSAPVAASYAGFIASAHAADILGKYEDRLQDPSVSRQAGRNAGIRALIGSGQLVNDVFGVIFGGIIGGAVGFAEGLMSKPDGFHVIPPAISGLVSGFMKGEAYAFRGLAEHSLKVLEASVHLPPALLRETGRVALSPEGLRESYAKATAPEMVDNFRAELLKNAVFRDLLAPHRESAEFSDAMARSAPPPSFRERCQNSALGRFLQEWARTVADLEPSNQRGARQARTEAPRQSFTTHLGQATAAAKPEPISVVHDLYGDSEAKLKKAMNPLPSEVKSERAFGPTLPDPFDIGVPVPAYIPPVTAKDNPTVVDTANRMKAAATSSDGFDKAEGARAVLKATREAEKAKERERPVQSFVDEINRAAKPSQKAPAPAPQPPGKSGGSGPGVEGVKKVEADRNFVDEAIRRANPIDPPSRKKEESSATTTPRRGEAKQTPTPHKTGQSSAPSQAPQGPSLAPKGATVNPQTMYRPQANPPAPSPAPNVAPQAPIPPQVIAIFQQQRQFENRFNTPHSNHWDHNIHNTQANRMGTSYSSNTVLNTLKSHADSAREARSAFETARLYGQSSHDAYQKFSSTNGLNYSYQQFASLLSSTGLVSSYNAVHKHPFSRIPSVWEGLGEIGGVATEVGEIEGLLDLLQSGDLSQLNFAFEADDGEMPFTPHELLQIQHELKMAIYGEKAFPWFSLHIKVNKETSDDEASRGALMSQYPVAHPIYHGTLVGEIIALLDYLMKGFLNGAVYPTPFIKTWFETHIGDVEHFRAQMIDLRKYCKEHGLAPYRSLSEMSFDLGLEGDPDSEQQRKLEGNSVHAQNFQTSFRIIAKQDSFQFDPESKTFLIKGDFNVFHDVELRPHYRSYLEAYRKEHGTYPRDYLQLQILYQNMAHKIKEDMPKLPFCKKMFKQLMVISFFSYLFNTLMKAGVEPKLPPLESRIEASIPREFPCMPRRYVKYFPVEKTFGDFLTRMNPEDLLAFNAYLFERVNDGAAPLPAVIFTYVKRFLCSTLEAQVPAEVLAEDPELFHSYLEREQQQFKMLLEEMSKTLRRLVITGLKAFAEKANLEVDASLLAAFETDPSKKLSELFQIFERKIQENYAKQISEAKGSALDQLMKALEEQLEKTMKADCDEIDKAARENLMLNLRGLEEYRLALMQNLRSIDQSLAAAVSTTTARENAKKAQLEKDFAAANAATQADPGNQKLLADVRAGTQLKALIAQMTEKANELKKAELLELKTNLELEKKKLESPDLPEAPAKPITLTAAEESCVRAEVDQLLSSHRGNFLAALETLHSKRKSQFETLFNARNTARKQKYRSQKMEALKASKAELKALVLKEAKELKDACLSTLSNVQEKRRNLVELLKTEEFKVLLDEPIKGFYISSVLDMARKEILSEKSHLVSFGGCGLSFSNQKLQKISLDAEMQRAFSSRSDMRMIRVGKTSYAGFGMGLKLNLGALCPADYQDSTSLALPFVPQGETALIVAASCGQTDIVKQLLDTGTDVRAKLPNGASAIYAAIQGGWAETALLLIQAPGTDLNQVDPEKGQSLLHVTLLRELDSVALALIAKGADTSIKRKSDGKTPFHLAAEKGMQAICKAILDRPEGRTRASEVLETGETALHLAARQGYLPTVTLLLRNLSQELIDAETEAGQSALLLALEAGHFTVARVLLDCVNPKTEASSRALTLMGQLRAWDLADILIARGVNLAYVDSLGNSYAYYLLLQGEDLRYFEIAERLKLPLDTLWKGRSSLAVAMQQGRVTLAARLTEKGATYQSPSKDPEEFARWQIANNSVAWLREEILKGGAPLKKYAYWAASSGSEACLDMLLKHIEAHDLAGAYEGKHLLYAAAKTGKISILERVLRHSPSSVNDSLDSSGQTLAHRVADLGHYPLFDFLLKRGLNFLKVIPDDFGDAISAPSILLKKEDEESLSALISIVPLAEFTPQVWESIELFKESASPAVLKALGLEVIPRPMLKQTDASVRLFEALNANEPDITLRRIRIESCQSAEELLSQKAQSLSLLHHLAMAPEEKSKLNFQNLKKAGFFGWDYVALFLKESEGEPSPVGLACLMSHFGFVKMLFDANNLLKLPIKKGGTWLHVASTLKSVELVEYALERGVNVNTPDEAGVTPLMILARLGHLPLLECLLKEGAESEAQDRKGDTALNYALFGQQTQIALRLIPEMRSTSLANREGQSPLMIAVSVDLLPVIQILDVQNESSRVDEKGFTALHLAALNGAWRVMPFLVEQGFEVNALSKRGAPPLALAAAKGHWLSFTMLLHLSADPLKEGVFSAASLSKEPKIASLLLDLPEVQSEEQQTRLWFAAAGAGNVSILRELTLREFPVQITHEKGGYNALHLSAFNNACPAVRLLLMLGLSLQSFSLEAHETPLHMAVQGKAINAVRLLIDIAKETGQESVLDQQTVLGKTATHLALEAGHAVIACILIKSGAKTDIPDAHRMTARMLARSKKMRAAEEVLEGVSI